LKNTDTVLLVGTAFYTSLAARIVKHAIFNRLNIVEVNLETQLKLNDVIKAVSIEASADTILSKLVE
jgi:NAD-dependent SIR2 family protein deacetylase